MPQLTEADALDAALLAMLDVAEKGRDEGDALSPETQDQIQRIADLAKNPQSLMDEDGEKEESEMSELSGWRAVHANIQERMTRKSMFGEESYGVLTLRKRQNFFEVCDRDDKGHCKPGSGSDAATGAEKEKGKSAKKTSKSKATRGEMHEARREGAGKNARIVLADGSQAPAHITPKMVPPAWTDVRVSLNPNMDVQVTGRDAKGKPKTVYSESWNMKTAARKFARIRSGLLAAPQMAGEIQRDRHDSAKRDVADCAWLMMEQGTRPGSEADNKGVKKLFGHPLSANDVSIGASDKQGIPAVALKIDGQSIKVKDQKARAEIARRVEAGEPLHDSTFWLKSYGATTLEGRHVVVEKDGSVRLQFMGKESVWHNHRIHNPELASMLVERKKAAGDDGKLFAGAPYDKATDYVKTLDGGKHTPKDLRTMKGTSMAIGEINRTKPPTNEKEYQKSIKEIAEKVSGVLGNKPAQALSTYIDPTVFSGWREAIADAK